MSSEELKPCSEPQAHPERCGCQPDAFQIARHSKRLVEQQRERIAALEAENARLLAANLDCVAHFEQMRAQLAAIQGGMGEDVAALATVSMGGVEYGIGGAELGDIDIQPDMEALCALQQSLVTGEDDAHVELIDKAQHQRITAAMAAEVERLRELCECNTAIMRAQDEALSRVNKERDALRAELAEVKGREAVPVAIANKGDCAFWVSWTEAGKPLRGPGIKLYTTPPTSPDVEGLVKALEHLLSYADRQVCTHEETHRGGAIWEICDMCGAKWADDEGGKPEFKWPDEIEGARTALSTWRQAHTPSTLPASSAEE